MVKFGGHNIQAKEDAAWRIIMGLVILAIVFFVAGEVFDSVNSTVNFNSKSANPWFYDSYKFVGFANDGTNAGLITVVGLLSAVGIIMSAFRYNRVG